MSKFYYDVCIDYDEEKSWMGPLTKESKVEKIIDIDQALLNQPGDYNLCVSKFSINTESLPVFIPKLNQPQKISDINKGKLKTTYAFMITIAGYVYKATENEGKPEEKGDYTEYYARRGYGNVYLENESLKGIEKIGTISNGNTYVNNLDERCYCYSYNDFIKAINQGLIVTTADTGISENLLKQAIKFRIVDGKIEMGINKLLYTTVPKIIKFTTIKFHITEDLYRLIGMGFPTNEIGDTSLLEYKDRYFIGIDIQNFPKLNNEEMDNFVYAPQSFSTLLNWNPLKSIIIGTNTLPVVPEFIPIAHHDGHLSHYKTQEYLDFLAGLGLKYNDSTTDVFKRNSLKILDVYYPMTTAPGDIRSTCILSRDNIDQGQTIELLPSSPVNRFDVWVRWLDIYGNLHDLYQGPGCCTDIRFCFTKKPVNKEDLSEGLSSVVNSLAPPDPKKARGDAFLKQLAEDMPKSNGKPDGIDIPGADNYGWVHL